MNRRAWLKSVGAVSALASIASVAVWPTNVWANIKDAFKTESLEEAVSAVTAGRPIEESDAIKLKIPDIAENGAVVPVSVSTDIVGVSAVSLVIENNPNPLTARFEISSDSFADVSTRVKMGESSMVRVFVETSDKIYTVAREVKVTIGGCGG